MTEVCSELRYEYMPAGSFAYHTGDFGDKFYLIIQGKVNILESNLHFMKLKQELELKKHQENNPFGIAKSHKTKYKFHMKQTDSRHDNGLR